MFKTAIASALALGALSTGALAIDCAYEKCYGTFSDLAKYRPDPNQKDAPAAMPYSPCSITWGGTTGSLMQRGINRSGCGGFHPGARDDQYSDGYHK